MTKLEVATGPSLTVRSISDFADQLRDSAGADEIVIDIAELAEVDLSFVQLVEVARRDCGPAGKLIRLSGPAPERLRTLLQRCGYLGAARPDDFAFWFQGEALQ